LSPFKKIIYLDSDLLFFQKSEILWKWINKPSDIVLHLEHSKGLIKHHNQPEDFDYIFRTLISRTSTPLVSESFNTGLLAIPNSSIFDLTKINNVFKIFNKSYYSRVFNSEETAVAAALVNKSCFSLPSETHVVACWTQEYEMLKSINPKKKLALLHYVYELKQFFERDAVELFFTNNFFRLPR
jgi:lipopolysaccharide biosynthesis glycosyltransferase